MYLLDSDILIFLCKGKTAIQDRICREGLSNCRISDISLAEILVGPYKNGWERDFHNVRQVEKIIPQIPLSKEIIHRYAGLRAQLEGQGIRLEDLDLLIAATALVNDYTLVSHNTRHFSRIPGLKLEDWIQE